MILEFLVDDTGFICICTSATPPTPLPSTTSRTGRSGRALKRRYVVQAIRGSQPGIGRNSVVQAGSQWIFNVADGERKTQLRDEMEGRPEEEDRVHMRASRGE